MKNLISFILFSFIVSLVHAQPCKLVKQGMTKSEVLKLVGKPTEIDTIGSDKQADGSKALMIVWQYGDVTKAGNQRVGFTGDKVDSDVIADGKKYDELMASWRQGNIPKGELKARIEKLNKEACK